MCACVRVCVCVRTYVCASFSFSFSFFITTHRGVFVAEMNSIPLACSYTSPLSLPRQPVSAGTMPLGFSSYLQHLGKRSNAHTTMIFNPVYANLDLMPTQRGSHTTQQLYVIDYSFLDGGNTWANRVAWHHIYSRAWSYNLITLHII